jgi:hypothetical protein
MAHSIAQQILNTENGLAGDRLRVSFDVVVTDPQALWHAAARIAFRQPGVTIADVEDVLGPVEDPNVSDCLTMLTTPDALPGCMPLGFMAEAVATPQPALQRDRAMRSLAVRDFMAARDVVTKQ